MKKIIFLALCACFFACKTKSTIGEAPQLPAPVDTTGCADTDNPFSVGWMDKAIDRHNPTQVVKYGKSEAWMYLFRGIPSVFLYDCQGNFICESRNDHDPCHDDHMASLGRGKIIWQGEGVWD